MKKYAVILGSLLALCGVAHAAGRVTVISATPASPTAGQPMQFKIGSTGSGICFAHVIYEGPGTNPGDKLAVNAAPGSGGGFTKTLNNPGTFNVKVVGDSSLNPKCEGEANLKLVVKASPTPPAPAAHSTAPATGGVPAGTCPSPWTKSTMGLDTSKGEYNCVLTAASCPDGYVGQQNSDTGQLVCNPKPQPVLNCPNTFGTNISTSYFKDYWSRMGCKANMIAN